MKMSTILNIFQNISVFILFATMASAQTTQSVNLTNAEKREAIEIAKLFETKMNLGKDIAPVLEELFVKDFLNRYLQDKENYSIPIIKYDDAVKFKTFNLRNYFISTVNFEYLTDMYFLDNFYIGRNGDNPSFENLYPPGVATLVKKIYPEGEDETGFVNEPKIETEEQLLTFIETQNEVVKLVRDYLAKHPPLKSATYRKNLRVLEKQRQLLKPSVTICPKSCYGFPEGSKLIRIDTIIYQLLLVGVEGKLKIINLASD